LFALSARLPENLSILYNNADAAIFDGGDKPVRLFSREYLSVLLLLYIPYKRPRTEADQRVEGLKPVLSEDEVVSHDVRALEALGSSTVRAGHVGNRELKVIGSVELQTLVVQVFSD
jgi:hypothetical protein